MKEKLKSIEMEQLSNGELQDIIGGFPLLVVALVLFDVAVVGMAVYGAYQLGYDKACGCND